MTESAYRSLPSVGALLQREEIVALLRDFSHDAVTTLARDVLSGARAAIKSGTAAVSDDRSPGEQLAAQIVERAERAWGVGRILL